MLQMKVAGEELSMRYCTGSLYMLYCAFYDYNLPLGFVTDGEWNSLHTKGNTGPLSALQIQADVRAKYSWMSFKNMSRMLMPLCMYM